MSSLEYKRVISVLLQLYILQLLKMSASQKNIKKMPVLGFGTWQAVDDLLEKALEAALKAGYRHIDTAYAYENEKVIGKVINRWMKEGKLKREDLYLVTKLPPSGNYADGVKKYLKRSLDDLQVDYVDMYLIHTPFRVKEVEGVRFPVNSEGKIDMEKDVDLIAVWKAMEEQQEAGLTRAIGVSNFNISQINRILKIAKTPPSNLQVELHAYLQQKELVAFCKKHNIEVTAYSPLGSPGASKMLEHFGIEIEFPDILRNPVVTNIAKKHNKTAAQVLLRHIIQNGIIAIPKSTTPTRVNENYNIFDFALDEEDMKQLNSLDKGPAGRIFDLTMFAGAKEHPEYPFHN